MRRLAGLLFVSLASTLIAACGASSPAPASTLTAIPSAPGAAEA